MFSPVPRAAPSRILLIPVLVLLLGTLGGGGWLLVIPIGVDCIVVCLASSIASVITFPSHATYAVEGIWLTVMVAGLVSSCSSQT